MGLVVAVLPVVGPDDPKAVGHQRFPDRLAEVVRIVDQEQQRVHRPRRSKAHAADGDARNQPDS